MLVSQTKTFPKEFLNKNRYRNKNLETILSKDDHYTCVYYTDI